MYHSLFTVVPLEFTPSLYNVTEGIDASVDVCVSIGGVRERDVFAQLVTQNGTATGTLNILCLIPTCKQY